MSGLWSKRWKLFRQNRRSFCALILFCMLFFISVLAPVLSHDKPLIVSYGGSYFFPMFEQVSDTVFAGELPTEADYKDAYTIQQIQQNGWMVMPVIPWHYDTVDYFSVQPVPSAPSARHWLGTDDQGRDVLARLIYAVRLGIFFGLILTFFSCAIGVVVGAIQGYFGGWIDLSIGRFLEVWGSLPQLFVLMILSSFIVPGFWSILLILLLFSWTSLTGVVRAEFLRTRGLDYVKAARGLGVTDWQIMWRHILPNALVATITYVPFLLAGAIVALSALDFLGLGLPVGTPSLGELIRQGKDNLNAPWLGLTAFFSLTVILSLLVFIGEGVRDAFDPHKVGNK